MAFWLEEELEAENGRVLKVRVTQHLETIRTPFQQIDVFESQSLGKMFTLDGVVMMTESDEHCYHEMIAHVPLMSHPSPETVLVIGGGDGGTVREVLKHPTVKEVHLCEIDKGVVDACLKHFPDIAKAMLDPKVIHAYEDGAKYVNDREGTFDVIIIDSSDPIGPAEVLFQEPFYRGVRGALREGGICVAQAEGIFWEQKTIQSLFSFHPKLFNNWGYYYTLIPTYPSGTIGFSFLSNTVDPYQVEVDSSRLPQGLRYYSPAIHKSAFVLPEFARKLIPARG